MKNARLIPVLALAAPLAIFGFIYVLAVQPNRAAEQAARARAASLSTELAGARAIVGRAPPVAAVAQREFEELTPAKDSSSDVADAVRSLLEGPAVGGVSNVSIEPGDVARLDGKDVDPRIRLFAGPIAYRPLTVTFDARYPQFGKVFSSLRALPSTFELRSVDIVPAPGGGLKRARILLRVYQRSEPQPSTPLVADAIPAVAPSQERAPRGLESDVVKTAADARPNTGSGSLFRDHTEKGPAVQMILFSSQHKVALVDGRIVRVGDYVGSAMVRTIEQHSVVLVTATGLVRRLVLDEPSIKAAIR